jgi:hypothetical protein
MDADDVAMPHRFEVELPLIAEADIVGAGLYEFVADTDDIVGRRVPPTDPPRSSGTRGCTTRSITRRSSTGGRRSRRGRLR